MMIRNATSLILALILVACAAEVQTEDFIRRNTPVPPSNIVFTENFEGGLEKWQMVTGTWTTSPEAANGLALTSPTGTSATTFAIRTTDVLDLTGKTGCVLQYEVLFNVGSSAGTSAKVLFGSYTLADFKPPLRSVAVSSGGNFRLRRARIPDNSVDKLTFQTSILNSTAAGSVKLNIDNIVISCANSTSAAVDVVNEGFETSVDNFSLVTPWARVASVGVGGSYALHHEYTNINSARLAAYIPDINLIGRQGCRFTYYYYFQGGHPVNFMTVNWNSQTWISYPQTGGIQTGTVTFSLAGFEGTDNNQLAFVCSGDGRPAAGARCTIDNLRIYCEE